MVLHEVEYGALFAREPFRFFSERHWLLLFTGSRARIAVDDTLYEKPSGQMYCCPPGHALCVAPLEDYCALDYCEFSPAEQEQAVLEALALPVRSPNAPPNFSELTAFVKTIYYLFYSLDTYRLQKLDHRLWLLLYSMADGDYGLPPQRSRSEQVFERIRLLRAQIADDPSRFQTIAEAAAFVGLSEFRFEHLYRRHFQISYTQDLIRRKLKRGCHLLVTTQWTIARIAKELGYENDTHFYRQFRQHLGVSPGEYRKQEHTAL